MSTNRSNVRASLCSFTFADGRQCRTPRAEHPYLCAFHARKDAQLSGAFISACDLSSALGRLFSAVAQGQMMPKTASTLAYLGQTLVQALPHAKHEYVNAFGSNNWREAIRTSHEQSEAHISPHPESSDPKEPDPNQEPASEPASTPEATSDDPPTTPL